MTTLILDKKKIFQKIKRIAYEIYENNIDEQEIVFIGVKDSGYQLAKLLINEFEMISPIRHTLVCLSIDKNTPHLDIKLEPSIDLNNKTIIIVDDVLNTGKTLAYCLKPFFDLKVNKIQTAVMVDRDYHLFPIKADYVGYQLSTTLQEHVSVILDDKEKIGVYIS